MQTFFVLIKCALGATYSTAEAIMSEIEETSEVHSISGEYDLLAKFYLSHERDTGRFVTDTLQQIQGVESTYTLVAFNAFT
ncbi:Lrp/AsnC family transcriptional regulator [Acidihalobacter ferrooxydans]|uniref:AsnC family transcriptional regulator n=1 Tax=Acidihalobacter ferrooxydans TaxID=1765967 RepID=A0A1P8UE30_9GAMM|nr:Lrp/AsnC ligand binding domain-containing protein [Acidihalobacter ferrooxydans]APZ42122.1 AsnC family transcriptional regulator [Acidihalobacter ferrooxydans]